MAAIRIRKTIDSDTLTLPELRPLIGRTVDIVIEEPATAADLPPGFRPGTGDWDAFDRAAAALRDSYDYDAQADQDACDVRDAEDRLR
jgi:hypothetical protein